MRSLTCSSAGIPVPSPSTAAPGWSTTPATTYSYQPTMIQNSRTNPLAVPAQSFFNLHSNTHLLSSQAKGNVTRAIQGGWASTTLKRYTGAIKQYIRFCDAERIPENLRFPADEFVLCAFAASSFGRHADGTPRSRLSALKAWHLTHNVEWKGSARLRYVLKGVHNFAPFSSRQAPRPPVTRHMLIQLVRGLDLSNPLDAAVAACAVTAFWGQCRLGELLPIISPPPSPLVLLSRSDFKRSRRNPQACILHLPVTKTHRHGQDVVLVDQEAPLTQLLFSKTISDSIMSEETPTFFPIPSQVVLLL